MLIHDSNTTSRAEKADKEYADSVKKYKSTQEKVYREEMPKILQVLTHSYNGTQFWQEFQVMEEDRIKSTKSHFESVLGLQEPIPENIKQINQALSRGIQSINAERDIDTFVKKNKNAKTGPDYAVYEPYDAESPAAPSTTSGAPSDRNSLSSSMLATSPKENSPLTRELSHTLSKSKESLNKSSSSLNNSPAANNVRAQYDYNASDENELSFKANDIITVLQKDDSGWWQGSLPNGKIGMFPR